MTFFRLRGCFHVEKMFTKNETSLNTNHENKSIENSKHSKIRRKHSKNLTFKKSYSFLLKYGEHMLS